MDSRSKPRPSNPSVLGGIIPQVRVNGLVANPGDGTGNVTTAVIFGSDSVLHANNLEQDTYELIDNVRYTRENHTFKVGTNLIKVHVFNDFFFNGFGSFTFNNLTDFANRTPASFTRALPFTPTSGNPVALFDVYEAAVYAQDEWQVTPKLFLKYGLRYDVSRYPDKPRANPILGQAVVEGVFRTLKDPLRLALRPQYHWTDQKLHVHALLCVVAYLLATLVHLTAVRDAGYVGSVDTLFDDLATIRRVTVARPTGRGRLKRTHQLELLAPLHARLVDALGIPTSR